MSQIFDVNDNSEVSKVIAGARHGGPAELSMECTCQQCGKCLAVGFGFAFLYQQNHLRQSLTVNKGTPFSINGGHQNVYIKQSQLISQFQWLADQYNLWTSGQIENQIQNLFHALVNDKVENGNDLSLKFQSVTSSQYSQVVLIFWWSVQIFTLEGQQGKASIRYR